MYKILVIGDIHIGKKLNIYKKNIYNTEIYNIRDKWNNFNIKYLINTIILALKKYNVDEIVFLGDIFDKSLLDNEKLINCFLVLIEKIITINENVKISIIIGNHDTRKPQDKYENLLSVYNNYKNINVYYKYKIVNNRLYLPYYKRDDIIAVLNEIDKIIKSKNIDNLIIFSHNDFYIEDIFIDTQMIKIDKIKEVFGQNTIVFNGHIHNCYYNEIKNGIVLTGSISPTSFKDNPMSMGVCYVEIDDNNNINKYEIFKNDLIYFISLSVESHVDKFKEHLEKLKLLTVKPIIILRYYSDKVDKEKIEIILEEYNDIIIGYLKENNLKNKDEIFSEELNNIISKIKKINEKELNINDINKLFCEYMITKHNINIFDIDENFLIN